MPANQAGKPKLLLAWNGGKLKSDKISVLCEVTPFLKSAHN